jgi:hypothetical protein
MFMSRRCVVGDGASSVGSGPVGSGPVGSGPVGSGPVGSGPVGSGPVGSGPVGSGPVGSGPGLSYPTEGVRAGPEDLRQQGDWGHTVVSKLHALCLAEIGAEAKEADTKGEHSLG